MLFPQAEKDRASALFTDAIHQIETEHGNVWAFAAAALLAASELYSECRGLDELQKAFDDIIKAEKLSHEGLKH